MGDNDFPAALGGANPAIGFLQQYTKGYNDYSQAGTNIPSMRFQNKYGQEFGGPLFNESMISSNPSFEIRKGAGPLGSRSGEQLLRLQQGSGNMDNDQLNKALELRGLRPTGVQLPPI